MKTRFENKTVLVSGGTGYIGSAIVQEFYEQEANVYFTYHKNTQKAEELIEQMPNLKALKLDLRDTPSINQAIEKLYKEGVTIDILVNNAAMSQVMPLPMLDEEDVDMILDINIKSVIFLTKAVMKGMIRQKEGAIVNIGSIAGHRVLEVPVTYATTKAALMGFTTSLANELKSFNIRVNMVVPGMMEEGVARNVPEDLKKDFTDHCLMQRTGKAIEIAQTVSFLASPQSSYINAQSIFVDGGI